MATAKRGRCPASCGRVPWVPEHGGGTLKVSTAQGADKALEAVSRELDALPDQFAKYLVPSAGTYNCRPIAGTSRKSMHSYGVAIDLNTKYSAYWQWDGAKGMVEPDPARDRRHFREARLHLGRALVSLRHHAFRIPARYGGRLT